MQLSNIATAKLSELKAFCRLNNIIPASDLRLKQSWIDAAQTFLSAAQAKATEIIEVATSPEAVALYKIVTVTIFRFTYRTVIIACLLAIALGMSARDTWIAFREWLEAQNLTLRQPVAILMVATAHRRKHLKKVLKCTLQFQECRARSAIKYRVVQPATEFRQRINAARFVITR